MTTSTTTSGAGSDEADLVGFLAPATRPKVRAAALGIVLGLTGSAEGVAKLKPVAPQLLPALLRLVPCGTKEAASDSKTALSCLVNLSADDALCASLLGMNAVGRVMEYVRDKSCPHITELLMLLVNLTVTEAGSEDLLQLSTPAMQGLNMALLLKLFVTSAVTLLPGQPDPCAHIAGLLANSSRLAAGRRLLLEPGRGFLQALAAQLHPGCSAMRRQGCSFALRNCCISAEADGTLEQLLADEAVLARMLAPLGGAEPSAAAVGGGAPDKPAAMSWMAAAASAGPAGAPTPSSSARSDRDPDDSVRVALAESVAVLAATEAGRKALWQVSAPSLLQKAYEYEEQPDVCKATEAAARCFLFDRNHVELEPELPGPEAASAQAEQLE